jgi:predicted Zn-dependent protease
MWARVDQLCRQGQREAALSLCAELYRRFPGHITAIVRAGELLVGLGRPAEADGLISIAVAGLQPNEWLLRAHALIGRATGNLDEAELRFRRLCETFPGFGPGRADFVHFLLHARRDIAAAEQEALSALAVLPNEVWVRSHYAECAEVRGDHAEAHRRWHEVRGAHPNHIRAYQGEVHALLRSGKPSEAEQVVEEALRAQPDSVPLLHLAAEVAERRENWREARSHWSKLRHLNPSSEAGWLGESRALAKIGDEVACDTVLMHGVAELAQSRELALAYARAAARHRDWPEAARRWQAVRERFPEEIAGWREGVGVARQAHGAAAADALLSEACERFPQIPEIALDWARAAEQAGDRGETRRRLITLRERFRDRSIGWTEGARLAAEAGDASEAEELLAAAMTAFPQEQGIRTAWADLASSQARWTDAQIRWRAVWDASPGDALAIMKLREALTRTGQVFEADQVVERAVKEHPGNLVLQMEVVDVLLAREEIEQAAAQLRRIPPAELARHARFFWQICRVLWRLPDGPEFKELFGILLREPEQQHPHWVPAVLATGLTASERDPALINRIRTYLLELAPGTDAAGQRSAVAAALRLQLAPATLTEEQILKEITDLVRNGWSALTAHLAADNSAAQRSTGVPDLLFRAVRELATSQPLEGFDANALVALLTSLWRSDFALFDRCVRRLLSVEGEARDREGVQFARSAFDPARAVAVGSAPPPLERKLRVAVLVSGQLRGFREAWKSWRLLRFDTVDVRFFVHTWKKVGRKQVVDYGPSTLTPNFATAFRTAERTRDTRDLMAWYPNLSFAGAEVSVEELRTFYGTDQVVVEDDTADGFVTFSNPQKQLFKLRAVHKLLDDSGFEPDLVINTRPDKQVHSATEFDWGLVRYRSAQENAIFADAGKYFQGGHSLYIGDQFAVGVPDLMASYASAYDRQNATKLRRLPVYPNDCTAHASLASTLFYACVDVQQMPFVQFGGLFDAAGRTPEEVKRLLDLDTGGTPRNPVDEALYQACELDLARHAAAVEAQ